MHLLLSSLFLESKKGKIKINQMLQYKITELHKERVRTAEDLQQGKRTDVKSSEEIMYLNVCLK